MTQNSLELVTEEKRRKNGWYCQNCKEHSNKPSYCKRHSLYVGRKNCCDNWDRKKR